MAEPTREQLLNCAEWNLDMSKRFKTQDPVSSKRMMAQAENLINQVRELDGDETTSICSPAVWLVALRQPA
jgi:hypothetical protein